MSVITSISIGEIAVVVGTLVLAIVAFVSIAKHGREAAQQSKKELLDCLDDWLVRYRSILGVVSCTTNWQRGYNVDLMQAARHLVVLGIEGTRLISWGARVFRRYPLFTRWVRVRDVALQYMMELRSDAASYVDDGTSDATLVTLKHCGSCGHYALSCAFQHRYWECGLENTWCSTCKSYERGGAAGAGRDKRCWVCFQRATLHFQGFLLTIRVKEKLQPR